MYLAAAKVGGIVANNSYPADFIYENMMIESNIIHAAHLHNVNKLLFLGSSCIYPKHATQPIAESELLLGHWSRPMSRMRLPKLPVSSCANRITDSMAAIIAR